MCEAYELEFLVILPDTSYKSLKINQTLLEEQMEF
jgi:hypothetical protein